MADAHAPETENRNEPPSLRSKVSNISDRKRAEDALRLQAAMLQNLMEGIFLIGLDDGIIKFANPRFEAMFGYQPGEIIGKSVAIVNAPTDKSPEETKNEIMHILKTKGEWHGEVKNIKKDGTIFWCYANVSTFDHPDFGKVVVSIHSDITERKQAEQALHAQTDLLASVFESSPNILMLVDADGHVEKINRAGSEFADSPQEELIGLLGGEVFKCINSFDGKGCGRNPECGDCPVRTRMAHSMQEGETILNEQGNLIVEKDAQETSLDFLISTVPIDISGVTKVLITIVDITERKQAEEALQQSELQNRTILRTAQDGFWLVDPESGKILDVNDAYCQMSGYTREEILQMTISDVEAVETFDEVLEHAQKVKILGEDRFESFHKRKDGSLFQVEVSVQALRNDGGRNFAFIRDITARKASEEALRKSEEQYRLLFDEMLSGFAFHEIICDEDGKPIDYRFLAVNGAFESLTGLIADDLIGKTVLEVMPETESFWIERYGKVALDGITDEFDGFSAAIGKYYEARAFCPEPGKFAVMFHDVTDRKLAEKTLRENEQRFSTLMQQSPYVIEIYALDGEQVEVNRAYEKLWGFPASTTLNSFNVLKSKEVEDTGLIEYVKKAYAGETVTVPEYIFDPRGATEARGQGRVRWLSTRIFPLRDADDNVINIVITHEDVTARRQMSDALEKSEQRWKRAIIASPIPIMIHDENDHVLQLSNGWVEKSGYTLNDIPTLGDWTAKAYGIKSDSSKEYINQLFAIDETVDNGEWELTAKDGSKRIWEFQTTPLGKLNEDNRVLLSMAVDVTERKQAEDELRRSEENLEITLQSIGDAVIATDLDGRVIRMNPVAEKLTGWKFKQAKTKSLSDVFQIVNADTRKKVDDPVQKVLESGQIVGLANHTVLLSHDGQEYQIADSAAPIRDRGGQIQGVILTFSDVTEKYKAEDALRHSEENLKKAQHYAKVGSWIWNIKTDQVEWSDEMFTIFGINRQTFTGSLNDIVTGSIHPDDRARVDESNQSVTSEGKPIPVEYRVIRPDGSVRTVWAEAGELILDESGKPAMLNGIVQDITERKQAEEDLRVALTKYKILFNTIPLGVTVSDEVGNILESNTVAEEILGLSNDQQSQRSVDSAEWQIVRPDGTPMPSEEFASVRALKEKQLVKNVEMGIVKSEEETNWISVTADLLPLDGYGAVIAYSDISERKQVEEDLKRLLQEKEILLAEVHHRVKNNMQIIASLLGLQAREIKDERFLAAFEESRNRINSMTLVHEQLYRAREYAQIEFGVYIDQLASTLFNMYQVDTAQVQLQITAKEVYLDLEKAIPCGLLLNELITNSLKYAFPDGRKGKLWIKLKPKKGKMQLIVGDDGVGIPASFDFEASNSLGLQLVSLLTIHDLQGKITVEREKGTQFHIEFPVQSRNED